MKRRDFAVGLGVAPAVLRAWQPKVHELSAVQTGDVIPGKAIVWARSGRAGQMTVQWRTGGANHRVRGPELTGATDFTGRVELAGLPAGERIDYEVVFVEGKQTSPPLPGHFLTPPAAGGDVRFLWSGDTAGQGYGINPEWGGMRIYETMRRLQPHFFLHSGDTIYADGPIPAEVRLKDGTVWKNIVTEAKSKVAETLDEFRGAHRYNLLDENVRRFGSEIAQVWQWDDHECTNNWSVSKNLRADSRYTEKRIAVLAGRARQAFQEYAPMRILGSDRQRIYRHIPYGPMLDLFVIDMRSFRGPNTYNREPQGTPFLGRPQIEWLKQGVKASKAVWKVIAADMPLGLLVPDGNDGEGRPQFEAVANGQGPPLGRELEIAGLLQFFQQNNIRNTVWLTADVHYTAAHFYDPAQAQFHDFLPFWEFVSGPLNAGTFGPGRLDDTFGPQVIFQKAPKPGESNLPPSAGMQFFGDVKIDGRLKTMTVTLRDVTGAELYSRTLVSEVS